MVENDIKQPKAESSTPKGGAFDKAADFTFFISKETLVKMLPFFILVFAMLTFYIFIQHRAVRMQREKEGLKRELKELRAEFITLKSDLMEKSRQSEIVNKLSPIGVKELKTPPLKIEIKTNGKK